MRLHLLLPKVELKAIPIPSKCAYPECTSKQLRLHQQVSKIASWDGASAGGSALLPLP